MHGMLLSVVLLAAGCRLPSGASEPTVEVKVTQKYLVPVCLDGAPVNGDRHWRLTLSEHTLAFTMRNEPRHPATRGGTRLRGRSIHPPSRAPL